MSSETAQLTAPVGTWYVAPDIVGMRILIANLYMVGEPGRPSGWVLVDAGVGDCSAQIIALAERRFGAGARPEAIVLTHGHFDHVGAARTLAERWDVPIYAHRLELPYLTGRADYPPPDPTVGGGAMAWLSFAYPRRGIDLGKRVRGLPESGEVPALPGWQALHTPGHAPGHISLFRMADRVLLAGDAIVTTRQESALAVLAQAPELHRPPAYFTIDWGAAADSAALLAALQPAVVASGHGPPMRGEEMRAQLDRLAAQFDELAVPPRGRYVSAPARAGADGIVPAPPARQLPWATIAAVGAGIGALIWSASRRRRPGRQRRPQYGRQFAGPYQQPQYGQPQYGQPQYGQQPFAQQFAEQFGGPQQRRGVIYG